MSWLNSVLKNNELKDTRKLLQIYKDPTINGPRYSAYLDHKFVSIDPIFKPFLNLHYGLGTYEYTKNGELYDKQTGNVWGKGTVYNKNTGLHGTWDTKTRNVTWDKAGEWAQKLINTGKYKGARMVKRGDGTYELHTQNGVFYGSGRAMDTNGNMRNFDVKTGAWINPKKVDKPGNADLNTPKDNVTKDNVPQTHTASFAMPTSADASTKMALKNSTWSTNQWGYNGNRRGYISDNIRSALGLSAGATARDAQNKLREYGFNISSDNSWGKQSQAAFDKWKEYNDLINKNKALDSSLRAQSVVATPKVNLNTNLNTKVNLPTAAPLEMFSNDDIRNLGFNNFAGMLAAVKANPNNRFAKAMTARYGDMQDQERIENELGVKGTYRTFGSGDFGDMSRSMASWMGTYNGNLERKNLQDRTGSDGVVYSNKQVRDLFEAHPVQPKTNNFDTSSFGTNIFGTQKKLQGGTINMNEQQQMQQAFLQYLAQQTGAKSQQELELIIQQMGEDGLKQAYAQFLQAMQLQQVQTAKLGAKLNYIRQLRGHCPDGTIMQYYKSGGRLCKKCIEMQARGGEVDKPVDDVIQQFKTRKTKSVAKHDCGSKLRK